jgi:hypothetical protein
MKRIVVMAVLALALPVAAFAGNVDFGNTGGTLWGSNSGLTLSNSELTQVTGFGGMGTIQGQLGSVAFTTGALQTGGTLQGGGSFAPGGSFTITASSGSGLPVGVLFSGTFSSAVNWQIVGSSANGSIYYQLSGQISGNWFNGQHVEGATTQITFKAGKDGFMGSLPLGSGNTVISTVPEPGTLGLLGTGLVSLAGIVRRKFKV